MTTITPAPKRVIHIKPMLRTSKDRRSEFLEMTVDTARDLCALLAVLLMTSAMGVICLMLR